MAAKGHSDKMASDVGMRKKQWCVTEPLRAERIAPIDIHCLLNADGGQIVHVSMAKWWMVHFSDGDIDSESPLLVQAFMSVVFRLLFIADESA